MALSVLKVADPCLRLTIADLLTVKSYSTW